MYMYFQLGVDVGSSTVARGVVSLVLGYLTNLVIEMAFLIQVCIPSSNFSLLNLHQLLHSCFIPTLEHTNIHGNKLDISLNKGQASSINESTSWYFGTFLYSLRALHLIYNTKNRNHYYVYFFGIMF